MDAVANLPYALIATAPSPADSGTSLVLDSGLGAVMPATPFNATAWAPDVVPNSGNAEIVTVTARVGDTLTLVRAQEGTSAKSVAVGWQFAATVTAKMLNELDRDRAPALNVCLLANHTAVYVRRLLIASGKHYLINSGAAARVL